MDDPKPDNIQSQPAERRPEEIQAGRPPPRGDAPTPLPDYNFKKRENRWPVVLAILFVVALSCGVAVPFLPKVQNKTFSRVNEWPIKDSAGNWILVTESPTSHPLSTATRRLPELDRQP
jgi:hypothetical protein